MLTPTKTEINAALAKFAADPLASADLQAIVSRERGDSIARITTFLSQPNAEIGVKGIGKVVVWLKGNWDQLDAAQKSAARIRLQALRTSGTAREEVKEYLNQVMRRYANIGDDDNTALARLGVILAMDAKDVDAEEFQHLMNRARAIWETLPS